MTDTMKSLLEHLVKKGYDLDECIYLDIRYVSKEGSPHKYHRFDLRRGRTFGKAPKSMYFAILWQSHDHYNAFARANGQWFTLSADAITADEQKLARTLLERKDLPLPYKAGLEKYLAWPKEDRFLHRIFGDGFNPDIWINPRGTNKELMREIAEFYCCWIG